MTDPQFFSDQIIFTIDAPSQITNGTIKFNLRSNINKLLKDRPTVPPKVTPSLINYVNADKSPSGEEYGGTSSTSKSAPKTGIGLLQEIGGSKLNGVVGSMMERLSKYGMLAPMDKFAKKKKRTGKSGKSGVSEDLYDLDDNFINDEGVDEYSGGEAESGEEMAHDGMKIYIGNVIPTKKKVVDLTTIQENIDSSSEHSFHPKTPEDIYNNNNNNIESPKRSKKRRYRELAETRCKEINEIMHKIQERKQIQDRGMDDFTKADRTAVGKIAKIFYEENIADEDEIIDCVGRLYRWDRTETKNRFDRLYYLDKKNECKQNMVLMEKVVVEGIYDIVKGILLIGGQELGRLKQIFLDNAFMSPLVNDPKFIDTKYRLLGYIQSYVEFIMSYQMVAYSKTVKKPKVEREHDRLKETRKTCKQVGDDMIMLLLDFLGIKGKEGEEDNVNLKSEREKVIWELGNTMRHAVGITTKEVGGLREHGEHGAHQRANDRLNKLNTEPSKGAHHHKSAMESIKAKAARPGESVSFHQTQIIEDSIHDTTMNSSGRSVGKSKSNIFSMSYGKQDNHHNRYGVSNNRNPSTQGTHTSGHPHPQNTSQLLPNPAGNIVHTPGRTLLPPPPTFPNFQIPYPSLINPPTNLLGEFTGEVMEIPPNELGSGLHIAPININPLTQKIGYTGGSQFQNTPLSMVPNCLIYQEQRENLAEERTHKKISKKGSSGTSKFGNKGRWPKSGLAFSFKHYNKDDFPRLVSVTKQHELQGAQK